MGLFDIWMAKIFMTTKLANPKAYSQASRFRNPSNDIEWSQLKLVDFSTIFSIWISCITFSIIILVVEIINRGIKNK